MVSLDAGGPAGPAVKVGQQLAYTGLKLNETASGKLWAVIVSDDGGLWKFPAGELAYCSSGTPCCLLGFMACAIVGEKCQAACCSRASTDPRDDQRCIAAHDLCAACAPKAGSAFRNELGSSCTSNNECCEGLVCFTRGELEKTRTCIQPLVWLSSSSCVVWLTQLLTAGGCPKSVNLS